jgi:hypothetical protein
MATTQQAAGPAVSSHRALAIAEADAIQAYKDLGFYRIEIRLEDDGWHVEYYLNKRRWAGGGPHYVIDATSGVILSKKYYQ